MLVSNGCSIIGIERIDESSISFYLTHAHTNTHAPPPPPLPLKPPSSTNFKAPSRPLDSVKWKARSEIRFLIHPLPSLNVLPPARPRHFVNLSSSLVPGKAAILDGRQKARVRREILSQSATAKFISGRGQSFCVLVREERS